MKKQPVKYEEFRKGCIYPLMIITCVCAVAIILILVCSLKSCHKSNYDYSPNAIYTVEDRIQTDEMRVFHSDKGLIGKRRKRTTNY